MSLSKTRTKTKAKATLKGNQKKSSTWFDFSNRKGTWYEVYGSIGGSKTGMHGTASRKEAIEYFKNHKDAIGIQIYEDGLTAGAFDLMPSKQKFNGLVFTRAYHGPHKKKFANSIAKDLRKSGLLVRIVSTDRGHYIYVG